MGSDLVEAARDWLGVVYRHQGRTRFGVDCAGLVVCAMRDLGIEIADKRAYSRQPFNGELESTGLKHFRPVAQALPGDVFLMSFAGNPVSHVAIYTGENIIHSYSNIGCVIEQGFVNGRPATRVKTMRFKEWL